MDIDDHALNRENWVATGAGSDFLKRLQQTHTGEILL